MNHQIRSPPTSLACAEDARDEARSSQTQLPGTAPHDCDACPYQGEHQGRARHLGAQQSRADTTVNVYTQEIEASVKETQAAIYSELTAWPTVGVS